MPKYFISSFNRLHFSDLNELYIYYFTFLGKNLSINQMNMLMDASIVIYLVIGPYNDNQLLIQRHHTLFPKIWPSWRPWFVRVVTFKQGSNRLLRYLLILWLMTLEWWYARIFLQGNLYPQKVFFFVNGRKIFVLIFLNYGREDILDILGYIRVGYDSGIWLPLG